MSCKSAGIPAQLFLLLVQVTVIFAVTRACGWLLERLRQPRVVGEIAGGLLLGPLALGHLLPSSSAMLFPAGCLGGLELVSQAGLVLFLFLIGLEVDLDAARHNRGATLAITVSSIAAPFALGAALAPMLLAHFGQPRGSRLGFVLFTGIAMSITALPVLARILEERRGTSRAVDGATASIALICAAGNDLVAWSLLAATLAITHGGGAGETARRLILLGVFVAVMFFVVRPAVLRVAGGERTQGRGWRCTWVFAMVAFAFLSARVTDGLGVHAFFGAFLAGICAPRRAELTRILECTLGPVVRLALPVFFAMTGLRMQREMFSGAELWWLGVVLAVAVIGKMGGAAFAARASGMQWGKAVEIGALLNTRGLVELVVLNVGYREGILSPVLFTIFVLMAIVTTAMTVPMLDMLELQRD
jgi:Kef-type K+ transport system membrane component KefB